MSRSWSLLITYTDASLLHTLIILTAKCLRWPPCLCPCSALSTLNPVARAMQLKSKLTVSVLCSQSSWGSHLTPRKSPSPYNFLHGATWSSPYLSSFLLLSFHFPSRSTLPTLFQPLCCSSDRPGTLLPQDLGICNSLCPECSSPDSCLVLLLIQNANSSVKLPLAIHRYVLSPSPSPVIFFFLSSYHHLFHCIL